MLLVLSSLLFPAYHRVLLDTANRLVAENQPEIATITAQMACEIRTEQLFAAAFAKSTFSHLEEAVRSFLPSYSLTNDRFRKLYTAITSDYIENQAFWNDYKSSVTRRHNAVHKGTRISIEEAQASCATAELLIAHLDKVAALL